MTAKDIKVVDRGSFFDDVFFKDSWEDFDKAMQNVFDRCNKTKFKVEPSSRPDRHDHYRKLRSDQIDDDVYASQAIQVNEKDGKFQVVMDVRDFNPRELQVKVIDERIVVEGRYDKVSEDGKSSSSKAFYKEFLLPLQADIDQLSTALSKDGVLTIRAPKKEEMAHEDNKIQYTNASHMIQNALNDKFHQQQNYSSNESFDNLSKDMRERLIMSDKDSGRGSGSGSPISSMYSTTPSCISPAPSDAWSTATEYDMGKRSPFQKCQFNPNVAPSGFPDPSFHNQTFTPMSPTQDIGHNDLMNSTERAATNNPMSQSQRAAYTTPMDRNANMSPPPSSHSSMAPPTFPQNDLPRMNIHTNADQNAMHAGVYSSPNNNSSHTGSYPQSFASIPSPSDIGMSPQYYTGKGPMPSFTMQPKTNEASFNKTGPAVGSGGTASINVKEEDGKRTLTQETSSIVQEKDGFLESKEVSSEIKEKDSQEARREANTRMMKQEEDPEGRFKRQEKADASDVNETSVKRMPDGSVMTVNKSSTSSSNFKQSFSCGPTGLMLDQGFPPAFSAFPNMMGRGQNLMSQMPPDSINSNMSQFSDMADFNRFPTMQPFPGMTGFQNRSQFTDIGGVETIPGFSQFSNMPSNLPNSQTEDRKNASNSFSSATSSYSKSYSSSSFDKSQF